MIDEDRAMSQDIRPLEILILNLMPIREETETQLLRTLSSTSLQVDCMFLVLPNHVSKNTSANRLNKFYVVFADVRKKKFDGMIITRAPAEHLEYEKVDCQGELSMIIEWTETRVTSTMYICWRAQAGLRYHYGIPKYKKGRKLSGIYRHRVLSRRMPLVRSMDNCIVAPHPRYTEVRREDTEKHPELVILAEPPEVGTFLAADKVGKQIFVQGHPEYDKMTLNREYHRDLARGISPEAPCNCHEDNDPFTMLVLCWRNAASTLYTNRLNFYVCQEAPYNLDEG